MSDPGLHSTSLSPQSVSSGGDSGVDTFCDHMSELPSIAISLCGGLTENREITKGNVKHWYFSLCDAVFLAAVQERKHNNLSSGLFTEQFHEKIVSYQQFSENPSIIDDPNLVVKIGSK